MPNRTGMLGFSIDERRFALPLGCVIRVIPAIEITPLQNAPAVVHGIIDVQGALFTVLNVRRCCGVRDRGLELNDRFILTQVAGRMAALPVDAVEVIECSHAKLREDGAAVADARGVRGVIRNEDHLMLVIDLDSLLSADDSQALDKVMSWSGGSA